MGGYSINLLINIIYYCYLGWETLSFSYSVCIFSIGKIISYYILPGTLPGGREFSESRHRVGEGRSKSGYGSCENLAT